MLAPGLLLPAEEFSAALKSAHLALPLRPTEAEAGAGAGEGGALEWSDAALPFAGAAFEGETASEVHGRGVQGGMSWMKQRDGPGEQPDPAAAADDAAAASLSS